jgi:hypothetical protein
MVRKVMGLEFPSRLVERARADLLTGVFWIMWTRAQVANASHDGAVDSELRLNYEDLPGVGGMGMITAMQNVNARSGM